MNASDNVVSRSIKRLVGDGNRLVANGPPTEKSHRPRIFSCITPRTDSISAADIIVKPVSVAHEDEIVPEPIEAVSTKSNSGRFIFDECH